MLMSLSSMINTCAPMLKGICLSKCLKCKTRGSGLQGSRIILCFNLVKRFKQETGSIESHNLNTDLESDRSSKSKQKKSLATAGKRRRGMSPRRAPVRSVRVQLPGMVMA